MAIIKKPILLGITILFITLPACQQLTHERSKETKSSEAKIKIVTTIAPLYCFTKNVTEDIADVENLLPSGIGPHEYSFSPGDVVKIKTAHVLIKNGVNLESWLDKLIASARETALIEDSDTLTVVDTSSGIDIIHNDPHIWLSPKNAVIQVSNIRDALAKIDPGNHTRYTENAEKYIKRLTVLDKDIRDEVAVWKKKEFVSFHSAFLYFAKDYNLRQVAVIQESPEKEPAPKHIADVINAINDHSIKAIFSEPQISHKIVKSIAQDLKLQVYTLDTLETGSLHPEWYEYKMRENLSVFKKALETSHDAGKGTE